MARLPARGSLLPFVPRLWTLRFPSLYGVVQKSAWAGCYFLVYLHNEFSGKVSASKSSWVKLVVLAKHFRCAPTFLLCDHIIWRKKAVRSYWWYNRKSQWWILSFTLLWFIGIGRKCNQGGVVEHPQGYADHQCQSKSARKVISSQE